MKTKLFTLLSAVALFVLTGCAATRSTITEYDASGNILKKTETSESVISSVTKSTQNKSVIIWEDGWAGYISVSSGTMDDPTPHGRIFAGKVNKGAVSLLPNQKNVVGIAKIIQATKSDLSVGLDGATAESSEIQTGVNRNTKSEDADVNTGDVDNVIQK